MKKLLYQLANDYSCNLGRFFDQATRDRFREEVPEPRTFLDSDGKKVLTLLPDMTAIVHKGYRWDGCSPKFSIFDLFWIGTPDGVIVGSDRRTDAQGNELDPPIASERITHKASAIHDVLGYCKRDPQMPSLFRSPEGQDLWLTSGRVARDKVFLEILLEKEFFFAPVYHAATTWLGPFYDLFLGQTSVGQP